MCAKYFFSQLGFCSASRHEFCGAKLCVRFSLFEVGQAFFTMIRATSFAEAKLCVLFSLFEIGEGFFTMIRTTIFAPQKSVRGQYVK